MCGENGKIIWTNFPLNSTSNDGNQISSVPLIQIWMKSWSLDFFLMATQLTEKTSATYPIPSTHLKVKSFVERQKIKRVKWTPTLVKFLKNCYIWTNGKSWTKFEIWNFNSTFFISLSPSRWCCCLSLKDKVRVTEKDINKSGSNWT